jgi:hypothetical protein
MHECALLRNIKHQVLVYSVIRYYTNYVTTSTALSSCFLYYPYCIIFLLPLLSLLVKWYGIVLFGSISLVSLRIFLKLIVFFHFKESLLRFRLPLLMNDDTLNDYVIVLTTSSWWSFWYNKQLYMIQQLPHPLTTTYFAKKIRKCIVHHSRLCIWICFSNNQHVKSF